jgi:hypothetical protein
MTDTQGWVSLEQCSANGVPPERYGSVANICKELYFPQLHLEAGNSLLSTSTASSNMCDVLFSYACILIWQVCICRYPFSCGDISGVLSCVVVKLGCKVRKGSVYARYAGYYCKHKCIQDINRFLLLKILEWNFCNEPSLSPLFPFRFIFLY